MKIKLRKIREPIMNKTKVGLNHERIYYNELYSLYNSHYYIIQYFMGIYK